jgi:ketosteroid isomerase-like protein
MRVTALAPILALILALILAWSAPSKAAEPPSPQVAEVLALNVKLEAAIAAGDAKAIAPFFAPEFRLQNSANRILTGEQVLAQFASGQTRFAAYDRQVEAAYASGDVVVLMGFERVRSAEAAAGVARRFTSVWRRMDGGWRQIARQSTNVASAP